jgi:hypothetical protein
MITKMSEGEDIIYDDEPFPDEELADNDPFFDDDEDDYEDDSDCPHCECYWEDGEDCCDCMG